MTDKDKLTAIMLHDIFCSHNHTDGCGWFYHKEDWNEPAHQKWLAIAANLDFYNDDEILRMIFKATIDVERLGGSVIYNRKKLQEYITREGW